MAKLISSKGKTATIEDLKIKGRLLGLISNSNDPSSTININPIVPKTGKIGFKSGISIPKLEDKSLTPNPNNSKRITDGIFVLEADMSNTYAKINKTERVIIIETVIKRY